METLQDRLKEIVQTSYRLFRNKIAGGMYTFSDKISQENENEKTRSLFNEASIQLVFGDILREVGRLFEYSYEDRFVIKREVPFELKAPTSKSEKYAIRDIVIVLSNGKNECSAAIEMKYLKNCGNNETTTNNRYSILQDIENLEHYTDIDMGFMLVYTDNPNYAATKTTSKYKIGHLNTIDTKEEIPIGDQNIKRFVKLINSYTFEWTTLETEQGTHCFMLQLVNPVK